MKTLIELPIWLGDCVMATPAIENIVNFHNDIEITFIGSFVSIEAMKIHQKAIKTAVLSKNFKIFNISQKKSINLIKISI
jgi:heptosyltransferase-2